MANLKELIAFEEQFGSAGRTLSRLIRPVIAARPGKTLVWGDWSAIEACVLPWLADTRGSREVLAVIDAAQKDPNLPDLYCREAAGIEGTPLDVFWDRYRAKEPAAQEARQTGKVAVLSLGFGGAVGALQNMATGYGISLTEAEAQVIVDKWRENNRWARSFWDALWAAFLEAMENPGVPYEVGRVVYLFDKGYMGGAMLCFLPDGRPLVYPQLKWKMREREDRDGNVTSKLELTYRRGYNTHSLWYGVLAENVTQATAASLLRELTTRLDPAPALVYSGVTVPRILPDYAEIVGHTHDEAIIETDDDEESVAVVQALLHKEMTRRPDWADGLPLASDVTTNWYYTKDKV